MHAMGQHVKPPGQPGARLPLACTAAKTPWAVASLELVGQPTEARTKGHKPMRYLQRRGDAGEGACRCGECAKGLSGNYWGFKVGCRVQDRVRVGCGVQDRV